MKRLIGFLIVVSLIVVAGSAFAAELNVGTRLYTKFLDRNSFDITKYATTGNGVGVRSELELTLDGKVSDRCEMGGRVLTVWDPAGITGNYSDWGGWFNGYANLWQVRGMWLRFRPATVPILKSVLVGSTDLGMFNAWTIGKIRWIDRDNARIIYGEGELGPMKYGVGLLPLPQFMAPDWGSAQFASIPGIPPDVRRSWATAGTISLSPMQSLNLKLTASHVIAIQQDPTSIDDKDGVRRFDNNVQTIDILFTPNPVYSISGLVGLSNYSLNKPLLGFDTWYPHLPYDDCNGNASKLTAIASDPFGIGLTLKGEYYNISPDFVSIMAARRETNVLISEGYVRYGADVNGSTWKGDVGFTPSAFADNGITDWNEANYQNIIGTNGMTFIPEFRAGALGIKGELSSASYGLNSQNVDTTKYWWPAPNRAAVSTTVDQSTLLTALRIDYLLPIGNGLGVFAKTKMFNWKDGVDTSIGSDDLTMEDTEMYAGASYQLTDEIGLLGGYKNLNYLNKGNGLNADTETYKLEAGMLFAEVKCNVGGADIGLAYEKVDGEDKVSAAKVNDMRLKATVEVKI